MLQRIGDALKGSKHHRWLAYFVVVALSLVFIAWGAFGIVNLSVGGSNYAAEANGTKIPLEEARNAWLRSQAAWQQRLGGAELPPQLRDQLQQQTLESLIDNALMAQRTEKLGYRVSAAELHQAIQEVAAFQIAGQYSPEAAKAALAQAGVPLDTFEGQLRTDVRRTHLEGGIRASNFITPAELGRLSALENQEREVRYLVLPADKFALGVTVDDAAIAAYYKAHQEQYLTPESDKLEYAELRLDSLAAQQTVSDADLHAAYDKAKSRLLAPEKRHAHHILITGKDDATALALAQQVLAQAKGGKDFGELAKQYSQDPGSAHNGGDLGWAERGSFVAPFADALFGMQVGEIKGPVKTQYGYHIIRLDEVQAEKGKSFEEARADLEAQLRRDRATDRFGEIQEQLQSKLAEPGADLTALAQEYHLEHGDLANFLKGAGGAPLGPAPQLQELLFAESPLAAGRIAGPVLLGDDRLVVAKVLEHHASQPLPLAAVRDTIVAGITKEQASQAALKAAEAARARLQAGTGFEALAQDLKVSAEPAHFIGRNDPSVPAPLRKAAFATAPPAAGKPVVTALALDNGGAAVLEVSAVRTAAIANPKTNQQRNEREAQTQGENDVRAYVDEVRRTADVKKNPKAFE
jgi:peptidyl-prolyl cis-trans isomerase D